MLYKFVILGILLILSIAGDIRNYKISNLIVLAGLTAGLLLNLVSGGISGLLSSILAAVIPLVLLIALFALRMLGAGDIKLFCAVGSIMGASFVLYAMAFAFLSGGIMALFIMLFRGNIKQRLGYIATYFKTCFLTGKLSPYTEFSDKSDGAKFHFSFAIASGCIIESAIILTSSAATLFY